MNTSTVYKCNDCNRELKVNEKPYPFCGSEFRDIKVNVVEKIRVRENLGLKKFASGIKKFLVHLRQGWFSSDDTSRYPEGVQITQLIDRENNFYKKLVVDEKTGKITKNLEEPLDQHKNKK